MYSLKKGDLIYISNEETCSSFEHIVLIDEYDKENNMVKASKILTFNKVIDPQKGMMFSPFPGFLSLANRDLKNGVNPFSNNTEVYINLNNFDIVGFVTNEDIITMFKEKMSGILMPGSKQKSSGPPLTLV